ncbi:MAG: SUMF1/EgtB/PvdO family nonheme iron enzyme [Oligoflexales bacterium]
MSFLRCFVFLATTTPFVIQAHRPTEQSLLIQKIIKTHKLNKRQAFQLTKIFKKSKYIGQGSQASQHPISRKQCLKKTKKRHMPAHQVCIFPFMVKISGQSSVCIDQFEFPNIPCEYPVTWVKPHEAHQLCSIMGKRLCDAHEWEAGCSGKPLQSEKNFSETRHMPVKEAMKWMRFHHNKNREKVWGYGLKENQNLCSTQSFKSNHCQQAQEKASGTYAACGSNTYPAGSSLHCKSAIGVYDLHGNVAEHMNLPVRKEQMGSQNGVGFTEMKGSWFIFSKIKAHADDCYWRAPFWHGTHILSPRGHSNYHLGFRCCSDIKL